MAGKSNDEHSVGKKESERGDSPSYKRQNSGRIRSAHLGPAAFLIKKRSIAQSAANRPPAQKECGRNFYTYKHIHSGIKYFFLFPDWRALILLPVARGTIFGTKR